MVSIQTQLVFVVLYLSRCVNINNFKGKHILVAKKTIVGGFEKFCRDPVPCRTVISDTDSVFTGGGGSDQDRIKHRFLRVTGRCNVLHTNMAGGNIICHIDDMHCNIDDV